MNVLMFTSIPMIPPWDQGDKNFAYELTQAMPDISFQVMVSKDAELPAGKNLSFETLYTSSRPSFLEKAGVYTRLLTKHWNTNGLSREPGRHQPPHLVHFVYRPYLLSALLLRLVPEIRRLPTIHTMPAIADGKPLDKRLFFADRVVALSRTGKRALLDAGVPNVVHIPAGIDVDEWMGISGHTDSFKTKLGLNGHPVLLFPGHWGAGQGSDIILKALPRIAAEIPQAKIVFACRLRSEEDRRREAQARQMIEKLGLSKFVLFLNTVPNMQTVIGASDIILLPLQTMRDKVDIPTTLLEGMAAGKPLVISDIPPMNEIIERSTEFGAPVGVKVQPDDHQAFAEEVIQLLRDQNCQWRMAAAGQEFVRHHFDIHAIARKYRDLYEEVCS